VIGKGSFGQVLKVYDHKTHQHVALKMVSFVHFFVYLPSYRSKIGAVMPNLFSLWGYSMKTLATSGNRPTKNQ